MKRLAIVSVLAFSLLVVPFATSLHATCTTETIVFVCAPQNGVVKVVSESESNSSLVSVGDNCAQVVANLLNDDWGIEGGDPEATNLGRLFFTFTKCIW